MFDDIGGKPLKNDKRPILLCLVGLSGGNQNLYCTSLTKEAIKNGFKPCIFLYRGTVDLPLTSPKVYCGNSWEDV